SRVAPERVTREQAHQLATRLWLARRRDPAEVERLSESLRLREQEPHGPGQVTEVRPVAAPRVLGPVGDDERNVQRQFEPATERQEDGIGAGVPVPSERLCKVVLICECSKPQPVEHSLERSQPPVAWRQARLPCWTACPRLEPTLAEERAETEGPPFPV